MATTRVYWKTSGISGFAGGPTDIFSPVAAGTVRILREIWVWSGALTYSSFTASLASTNTVFFECTIGSAVESNQASWIGHLVCVAGDTWKGEAPGNSVDITYSWIDLPAYTLA